MAILGNLVSLDWDSHFFNKKMAQIIAQEPFNSITQTELNDFDFVQAKVDSQSTDFINSLLNVGFQYVEGEVVFEKQIQRASCDDKLVQASTQDTEQLKNLVSNTYQHSRFTSPWFTEIERARFYSAWVEKAVLGQFDDICLVIKKDNLVLGCITLKDIGGVCRIGLLAVKESARGMNIGSRLMSQAEQYAVNHSLTAITVATQLTNIPAINFYNKLNYKTNSISHWLYK